MNEIHTFEGHGYNVVSVAITPDGKLLASASYDETIKLWDIESKKCLITLEDHNEGVCSVTFSPDGTLLASVSDDQVMGC